MSDYTGFTYGRIYNGNVTRSSTPIYGREQWLSPAYDVTSRAGHVVVYNYHTPASLPKDFWESDYGEQSMYATLTDNSRWGSNSNNGQNGSRDSAIEKTMTLPSNISTLIVATTFNLDDFYIYDKTVNEYIFCGENITVEYRNVLQLLQRRSILRNEGEKLILVSDTTITNEVIQPISFDSTTGYFEVDSFPSNFNVALNTDTSVTIHLLNTSVSPTLLPCKWNSGDIVIQKVDNTHFTIASNSVSSSGNYDVTAFCLEYNPPQLVRLCGTDMMYDNLFKIEATGVQNSINKYKSVGLHGISNYPYYAAPLVASSINYIYGMRLCDMTIYVKLGSDNSFYGYLKKQTGFTQGDRTWSLSRFTYKDLELTLDSGFGWGGRTGLYFKNTFLNGSTVKCYKVVE